MEGITNYYESLVLSNIRRKLRGQPESHDEEYIADVACVALNQLPARYVRHMVDTQFFETEDDIAKSSTSVEIAVNAAIQFINVRRNMSPDGSLGSRK